MANLHKYCLPGLSALILSSLCFAFTIARGQEKQDSDSVRIRTELVQIDVVVKDQKGNLVRDLRREDFEVFEDGKPQSLTHFAIGTGTRPAAFLSRDTRNPNAKPADPATDGTAQVHGRHIVLAVDDYHLEFENLVAAKNALTKFVENDLAADDQVAMMATSGAMSLYQQFTPDRETIKRAIARLSLQDRTSSHLGGIPYISAYQAEMIVDGDQDALRIAIEEMAQKQGRGGPRFDSSRRRLSDPRDPDEAVVRNKASNIVEENARYAVDTLSALEGSIRGLSALPGRKIMVLLSDGFFSRQLRGASAYDLRYITDAATRAGVVIYTIDARGLVAKPTLGSAADPTSSTVTRAPEARKQAVQGEIGAKQESLFVLAKDSGGLPFFNNNDLGAGLKRVLDDSEAYYVLAYQASNQARDGSFRKIEVRIAARPEVRIQTRAGYFAPTESKPETAIKKKEKPAKKAAQEALDLKLNRYRAALTSLVPLRGIPFEMASYFLVTSPGGTRALLSARIDASGINLDQSSDSAPAVLEVIGVVLDESGKNVNTFNHSFELKGGTAAFAQPSQKTLNYHNAVALGPGRYNVRLAVADSEMKLIGSASEWFEIPDLSQKSLTLSSLFLAEEGANLVDIYDSLAATLQGTTENGGAGIKPLQPVRQFKHGASLDFLLFAYNAQMNEQGVGNLLIQIKVFSRNKVIYTAPPNEMPVSAEQQAAGAPFLTRLPLDYEPGEYVLQVEVTDQVTKKNATSKVIFIVE